MESTCKLPKEECNIRYCPFDPYECETGREVMREAKENIKGGIMLNNVEEIKNFLESWEKLPKALSSSGFIHVPSTKDFDEIMENFGNRFGLVRGEDSIRSGPADNCIVFLADDTKYSCDHEYCPHCGQLKNL